jgi:TetR/AcrR family transcriptional regulator, regulator of autoinduction and epiphytic fitness
MQGMSTKSQAPRRYTNTRRTAQAAQTRADVVHAAIELFGEQGYGATTLAAIAERAGVAVETVYNGFGSKKKLLRAAVDVSVVGDTEPIPFIDRPEVHALRTGTQKQRIRAGMKILADIHERSAGIWRALTEAGASDEEVAAWVVEGDANRKLDVRRSLEMIFDREIPEEGVELLWAFYSPEVFTRLRNEGWTLEQYEQRMYDASTLLVPLLKQ